MVRAVIPLIALLAACSSAPPQAASISDAQPSAGASIDLRDWPELDRLHGDRVTVTGVFGHIRGTHGTVTLNGGLIIYLPHADLFLRNRPWFDYLGKRVAASGVLDASGRTAPGLNGPAIALDSFKVVEP